MVNMIKDNFLEAGSLADCPMTEAIRIQISGETALLSDKGLGPISGAPLEGSRRLPAMSFSARWERGPKAADVMLFMGMKIQHMFLSVISEQGQDGQFKGLCREAREDPGPLGFGGDESLADQGSSTLFEDVFDVEGGDPAWGGWSGSDDDDFSLDDEEADEEGDLSWEGEEEGDEEGDFSWEGEEACDEEGDLSWEGEEDGDEEGDLSWEGEEDGLTEPDQDPQDPAKYDLAELRRWAESMREAILSRRRK
ncbi:MAG: hypothetical protein LBE49_06245 [Deltaproteobacteria bacterium]|jgi:hypothetical protein|nr:hypothetical protein [Deltaproteobacteria bacterium]